MITPVASRLLTLVYIVLLFAVGACVNDADYYEEPELAADQLATLRLTKVESHQVVSVSTVQVFRIDGRRLPPAWRTVKILAGKHNVYAVYRRGTVINEDVIPATVEFDAEGAATYQIPAALDESVVRMWIEEVGSETVVGMTSLKFESSE